MATSSLRRRNRPSQKPSAKRKSLAERIRRPSAALGKIGLCVYAKGGTGKTTLLGTMPGKGLVIDVPQVEGGTYVLADKDNIEVVPVRKWTEFDEAYDLVKNGDWQWVAFDTITAAQELAKRRAIWERGKAEGVAHDPKQVTMQDWGKIGQLMAELIYQFNNLPVHMIFNAQERKRKEGDDVGVEFQPDVSPETLRHLPTSLNLIGRLFVVEEDDGEVKRHMRVGPSSMYVTKARCVPGRELPAIINKPHLGRMLAWMLGKEGAKKPKGVDLDTIFDAE